MINFDVFIKDDYKLKYKNSNPMTVQHPARCCIVGGSGSGKTNLLLNLLLNKEMKMDYNRLYVIAKDTSEDKYRFLADYFAEIEDAVFEKTGERVVLFTLIDKLEDVPDLDNDIDPEKQNVLVFDDVVTEKNQAAMIEYWIRSRKRNCTVFYLSQTFFKIPRTIRLNTEYFFIFGLNSRRELDNLYQEFGSEVEKKEFNKMFRESTKNRQYFLIDLKTSSPKLRYGSTR